MSTVAIQGTAGSFHDQAARSFFGEDYSMIASRTFRDVFEKVQSGHVDFGVVAIENSLHGSINPVYRLLSEHGLWVCGEVRLHIQLYLIGSTKQMKYDYSKVTIVRSQTEAISQCDEWLRRHLSDAHIEDTSDTAESVKTVVENSLDNVAAIASRNAADLYNGTLLAGPINDDPDNYTRFFILSKKPINSTANRTSVIMTEKDHDNVGTLHDALGVFKEYGINLSKLDSHTLPGKIRRYAFYIDFDENYRSDISQDAIKKIENIGWKIDILGSYLRSEH